MKAHTDPRTGRIVDVSAPPTDVIVLQRITHMHLIDSIKVLRERYGLAVVIDMDDDLAAIPPSNPAFRAMHPRYGVSREHNWMNTQRACEVSTFVTVSTPALLPRYAPHDRGTVIRNCIPARYLDVEHVDSNVVGWGGSVHSHPNDLQTVGSAMAQLVREGTRFRIVGPVDGARVALGLDVDPEATGPRDMHTEWPEALAQLGVGITPLEDTRFNAGKSWLKPLEYAALGVVPVMSPRAEYAAFADLGAGVLAGKPRQWVRHVRELTTDAARRVEMSHTGREIAAKWTIEDNAWRWWQAWEDAYRTQRSG